MWFAQLNWCRCMVLAIGILVGSLTTWGPCMTELHLVYVVNLWHG